MWASQFFYIDSVNLLVNYRQHHVNANAIWSNMF